MKKSRLHSITLQLLALGLVIPPLAAQTPTSNQSTPLPAAPSAAAAPAMPAAPQKPMVLPSANRLPAPQAMLTPEEMRALAQARMELQKDPDIIALNTQIRELMQKRMKLTEEKLQKINPEAAAILQKIRDREEKMMATRRAQMEAQQAKSQVQPASVQKPATPSTSSAVPPPASTP